MLKTYYIYTEITLPKCGILMFSSYRIIFEDLETVCYDDI